MTIPNILDWSRRRARLAQRADGTLPTDWAERKSILKALALGCLAGHAGFSRAMIKVIKGVLVRDVKKTFMERVEAAHKATDNSTLVFGPDSQLDRGAADGAGRCATCISWRADWYHHDGWCQRRQIEAFDTDSCNAWKAKEEPK